MNGNEFKGVALDAMIARLIAEELRERILALHEVKASSPPEEIADYENDVAVAEAAQKRFEELRQLAAQTGAQTAQEEK